MYKYVCTMAPSLQQSTFVKGLFKQIQGTINKGESNKTWQKHAQVTFYSNIKRKKNVLHRKCDVLVILHCFLCILGQIYIQYKYIYLKSILGQVFVEMKNWS